MRKGMGLEMVVQGGIRPEKVMQKGSRPKTVMHEGNMSETVMCRSRDESRVRELAKLKHLISCMRQAGLV